MDEFYNYSVDWLLLFASVCMFISWRVLYPRAYAHNRIYWTRLLLLLLLRCFGRKSTLIFVSSLYDLLMLTRGPDDAFICLKQVLLCHPFHFLLVLNIIYIKIFLYRCSYIVYDTVPYISLSPAQPKVARPACLTVQPLLVQVHVCSLWLNCDCFCFNATKWVYFSTPHIHVWFLRANRVL